MLGVSETQYVLIWSTPVLGGIVLLGTLVWLLRRRLFGGDRTSGGEIWSLQQLREMRAGGELSEAEFQRLRAAMIGQHAAMLERKDGVSESPVDGTDATENEVKADFRDSR